MASQQQQLASDWLASKDERAELIVLVNDPACPVDVIADWIEDNGGDRAYLPFVFHVIYRLDDMTKGYLEAALWSSLDEHDQPLDRNYGFESLSSELFMDAVIDCRAFMESCGELFDESEKGMLDQIGHDFWLSRNGHGAGLFDGPYENATQLQRAAKTFGPVDLYVGDDGLIYGQ